ncbi:AMP-binding enzyme, partial [Desulfotomaculum copahuensis]|uniref:AMP-binding enzyme n=1 Tax=Desulfotomaculum copahuensis TaxID=1838280 RepID=UPI0012471B72
IYGSIILRKGASVGKPVVNVEVRVVDDAGCDVPLGEVGEIVYRGPTLMKEYYRDPQATAAAVRDGWFHSGDLVRMDGEGFVYVVDRKKDMVISGGENVYPAEVEEVLYRHEKVLEAAVIGVPDERWGERVHAVVVPIPGTVLTVREIMEWCTVHLAGYKKPRSVEFVEALPRNASGKVLKNTLREWFGKQKE